MIILKRRNFIRILSYTLAAIIILFGFVATQHAYSQDLSMKINYSYQRAFGDFVTSFDKMNSSLEKSLYVTSPSMHSYIFTDIYGQSVAAQMSLAELPFSDYELDKVSSFMGRIGDYAATLSRTVTANGSLGDDVYESLSSLSEATKTLSTKFNDLQNEVNSGSLSISKLKNSIFELSSQGSEMTDKSVGDSISQLEQDFPEIPTLIYDGPFSQHIEKMKSVFLKDMPQVSSDSALESAKEFFDFGNYKFKLTGESNGNLPRYYITAQYAQDNFSVEVSKQGGIVTSAFNSRSIEKSIIPAKEAVNIAEKFLKNKGYESMKTSYWQVSNNIITVNFAYSQESVVCYPDLIKVSVALDNGNIVGFDATGYIMSHQEREIPQAKITQDDASEKISKSLKILSSAEAIIPTDGKNEIYCYEFKCENESGQHYIVYINTQTGMEEKMMKQVL